MTSNYSNKSMCSLLPILLLFTFCKGQIKTQLKTATQGELKASLAGQPKLTITLGSNAYQNITSGIQDKNGNLWFGTTGEGVYKYDARLNDTVGQGKLFTQFTLKDGLNSNSVFSLLEDRVGNIWFGTTNGICRTDGDKIISISIPFSVKPFLNNNNYYTKWSTENTVWSMLQDKTGRIWFGTGDGVYCYDGKMFTRFLANEHIVNRDSLQLKLVSDMLEDKNGNIWFASGMPHGYEGFCRYNGKAIESFKPKSEGWIRKVIQSKSGNLLLATRHFGVWSYDASLKEGFGTGKSFNDYIQPKELINGSLSAILEDMAGNLWVASDYGKNLGDTLGGLWHSNISPLNPEEKTFTKISNKEVYFLFEDK